jgi:predicted nucleotidyltransferase
MHPGERKKHIKLVYPMTFEKLKAKWQRDKELNIHRASAIKALLKDQCLPVYKNSGVQRVIIFGSILNNKFNKQSDIDIYVEPLNCQKYWDFQHDLEDILNLNIDLHTNNDEPSFVKKIIERGEVIYEA